MWKWLYHCALSVALRLVGLDFGWYKIHYVRVIHAVPIVEPFIQLTRSKARAVGLLGAGDALRFLKPADTVLDLGANCGSVSSIFLTLGLTVHAYEPDSRCVALLKRRFSIYGRRRCHSHHCAVADRNGVIQLNYGSLTTESNSIIEEKPGADGSTGAEVVPMVDIRDILLRHGYVPLIKMDIEGAEYDVLDAMLEPEFLNRFGVCLVEVHAGKIPSLAPRQRQLEEKIASLNVSDRVLLTWH